MSSVETIRQTFAEYRYVKLEGFIEQGLCAMLYDHALRRAPIANPSKMEGQEGAMELFGDQLMEFMLSSVHGRIEELSGLKLHPTYSFFRLYRRGNELKRHVDRPSCEVSVSLNLGPELETPWPLWVKGPLGSTGIGMAPGDAVLYRGIECEHWRAPLEADHLAQVFFHYVEQDGQYSEWKFDKRRSVGI